MMRAAFDADDLEWAVTAIELMGPDDVSAFFVIYCFRFAQKSTISHLNLLRC
jgi:hypothetical protein